MVTLLPSLENVNVWAEMVRPLIMGRFNAWAENDEPFSIFREMSHLVITVLLTIFTGYEFAEKHSKEIVPMVRAYESALQKPQAKALPRWMTKDGRLLEATERQMKALIDEEIKKRLSNPKQYENNKDYLQQVILMGGQKHADGLFKI